MSKERMSFFIMLSENPTKWVDADESSLMSYKESEIWDKLSVNFLYRQEHHHPCVRYEDVIGHLFMQAVGLMNNAKRTKEIIKSARQYANQIMKSVCLNCRHSIVIQGLSDLTAPGLSRKSSSRFAMDIRNCDTHKNCQSCRVAKIIVLGNSFDELLYARTSRETRNKYWYRLQTEMKRRNKWKGRAKKAEFTLKKVIELKTQLVQSCRALNEDRIRMQKENDKLRGYSTHPAIGTAPMPTGMTNVKFDEFKDYDQIPKDVMNKAVEKAEKDGTLFSIGSANRGDAEPGDSPRVPDDFNFDNPSADDILGVHSTIEKIPEGKHPLEALLEEEE